MEYIKRSSSGIDGGYQLMKSETRKRSGWEREKFLTWWKRDSKQCQEMVLNIEHWTKALELSAVRQKRNESAESVQAEQMKIIYMSSMQKRIKGITEQNTCSSIGCMEAKDIKKENLNRKNT